MKRARSRFLSCFWNSHLHPCLIISTKGTSTLTLLQLFRAWVVGKKRHIMDTGGLIYFNFLCRHGAQIPRFKPYSGHSQWVNVLLLPPVTKLHKKDPEKRWKIFFKSLLFTLFLQSTHDSLFCKSLLTYLRSLRSVFMMVYIRCILFLFGLRDCCIFLLNSLPVPSNSLWSCSSQDSQTICQLVKTHLPMRMQLNRHAPC